MKPLSLDGFDTRFRKDADPWRTFTDRDEAVKRAAILHALGPGPVGRCLELGAGAGANSRALARRCLRLDATDGSPAAVDLIMTALEDEGRSRWRACRLALPARPPSPCYDAVVVAEVLYYLGARDMAATAKDVASVLRPGGRLVLAHHRIDFYDFAQHAAGIHRRFLEATGKRWTGRVVRRTRRWIVGAFVRL